MKKLLWVLILLLLPLTALRKMPKVAATARSSTRLRMVKRF